MRQGDGLSLLQFNIYVNYIIKRDYIFDILSSDFASARHFRILRKGFLIDESISNQFRHFNFESVKKISQ